MIYLLRHGEIDSGGGKRFIGQLDLALTENGKKQAESWKKELSGTKFDFIYSSDLTRCSETARIVLEGNDIVLLKELREIDLGKWEGLFFNEVKTEHWKEWEARGLNITGFRPPGGESFDDLKKRVIPVFNDISQQKEDKILIITHAGVIRTIICHILEMPFSKLFSLGLDYAGMNIIDNNKEPMQLLALNRII